MTFWDFLNWIFSQAVKVYDWFSDGYWTLRNAASSAWDWASQWANWAYNQARIFVIEQYNRLSAWVIDQWNYLSGRITELWNSLYNNIIYYYNLAQAWVTDRVAEARTYFTGLYQSISAWVEERINWLDVQTRLIRDQISASVNQLLLPFQPLKDNIGKILDLVSPTNLGKIKIFLDNLYNNLSKFATDPIGFILGIIWPSAVTFFCYVIGYGLGSVEAQLPAIPSWSSVIIGHDPLQPPYPDIPSEKLVHPVDPLWVSGYSFGLGHPGTDFGISNRQRVYAMHDGIVTLVAYAPTTYGNYLEIKSNKYWSRYGHFDQVTVFQGQNVKAGDFIGYGDTTGNSTGNHLHAELQVNGQYVDLALWL